MIYSNDGRLISISFLAGGSYEGDVRNITQQKTRAGTGYCGSTSEPTNLTCYLKAADGVVNVSADASDAPLSTLVTFVDQLTKAFGTS